MENRDFHLPCEYCRNGNEHGIVEDGNWDGGIATRKWEGFGIEKPMPYRPVLYTLCKFSAVSLQQYEVTAVVVWLTKFGLKKLETSPSRVM